LKDTALGTGLFREEKKRIMAIAHEWLKLAGLEAFDLARLHEETSNMAK
jgi:hypothetical protein